MKFGLVTIQISDMEKSLEFYRDILGLNLVSHRQGGNGFELAFLGDEGQPQIELIRNPAAGEITYSGFNIGIYVDSLDAATELLESRGYPRESGPMSPSPHVRFSHFADPNGITVSLLEHLG